MHNTVTEGAASAVASQPIVAEQIGAIVRLANAGALPLGAYVRFGAHIGVVRSHERNGAIVELTFEREPGRRWGAVRRSVRVGAPAQALDAVTWHELLSQLFPSAIPVGAIRQDSVDCAALLPDLVDWRGVVCGRPGAGKSTLLVNLITASRRALALSGPGGRPRTSVVICDPHGDYSGRVKDHRDAMRPNLVDCLEFEAPVIVGPGDLCCQAQDVPSDVLVRMLDNVSPAQKRWLQIYVTSDDSHEAIRQLVDPECESEWASTFQELATGGELTKGTKESLVALRSKFRAILAKPLFIKGGRSTWPGFLELIDSGRVVVVDLGLWPDLQQSLLAILVIRTIVERQFAALRAGQVLQPVVLVADEAHRLKGAETAIEMVLREARKLSVGLILGSQRLADFSAAVLSFASHAVVLRVEGSDGDHAIRRWPALKPVRSELRNLQPGSGFVLLDSLALPVDFAEPAMGYGAGRRRGGGMHRAESAATSSAPSDVSQQSLPLDSRSDALEGPAEPGVPQTVGGE